MRRVLLFRTELLPLSETFIAAQAAALRRFAPVFAGLQRMLSGIHLDDAHLILLTRSDGLWDKAKRRFWLRSGNNSSFFRKIETANPALIHAHFAVDAAVALPLQRQLGVPLIVTLHGYDVTSSDEALSGGVTGRVYLRRRHELFRQASLFLCVSEHIRRKAVERGFPEGKLRTHRIGVDLSTFSFDPEAGREPVVLFVGRLIEKKGCSDLILAMAHVQAANRSVRLVILGDGPLRGDLEAQARRALRNVTFLGSQPSAVVREWMGRARLLAAPSIVAVNGDSEGLPIVLCEAQAMGLPITGYRGPGVSEAVADGESGLLANMGDIRGLTEAITALLRDDRLAAEMGLAGRRRAESCFDLTKQTARLEEMYAAVLQERAAE
jgi:glycosyltransferase involved in cell wall biosynthesis